MKFYACAFILLYLLLTGSAQPRYGRPHPLYNGQQQATDNFLTAALLFGLDFSEMPALQPTVPNRRGPGNTNFALRNLALALGLGPNLGMPTHPFARQRARQDMNALSMLGLLDGPDVPDGPAGAAGRRGRRGPGPRRAGAGGGGAAAGEAAEAAPAPAKTPRRKGPRRKRPAKTAPAAKK